MTHRTQKLPIARRGAVLLEVVVAAGLVVTGLAIATPIVFQTSKIWKQTRHHQIALDELNAQMDRLIMESGDEREASLKDLRVSPSTAEILFEASLTADLVSDSQGQRIELALDWKRIGDPPPVRLIAWINPLPEDAADEDAADKETEKNDRDETENADEREADQ